MMDQNTCFAYLNMELPDDIRRLKEAGYYDAAIARIDACLAEDWTASQNQPLHPQGALPVNPTPHGVDAWRQSLRKGVGILQAQVDGLSETVAEPEKHAVRIMEWANIFEVCSAETQKMIAGYMLKCVTVFQDYRMDIQTNDIGIAIPMLGTE